MPNSTLREIAAEIASHDSVVVASHYNPDPDAFGSSCGLSLALKHAGKNVICVNEDGFQERLKFIPGSDKIVENFPENFSQLLITVDCGDRARVGERLKEELTRFPKIINIDHHASNDFFGTLNYVQPHASSASELVLQLLKEMNVVVSADVATCLFIGLSADSGSFRYSATTEETFKTAADLVGFGAVPWRIAQELYANTKISTIKLQSEALSHLLLLADGKSAQIVITEEMCARLGGDPEEADDLKHILQSIAGVRASSVVRQVGDIWRVSMRSRDPFYDVSRIAVSFGGGGHRCAAAFRWKKSLEELKAALNPQLEALVSLQPPPAT